MARCPPGTQTEWISVGGDLVEAGVWWGPLREGAASRRATVLAAGATADWSHPATPAEDSLDDLGGIPEPSRRRGVRRGSSSPTRR